MKSFFKKSYFLYILRGCFYITMCVGPFIFAVGLYVAKYPIVDLTYVDVQHASKPSIVLDMYGNEIARFTTSTKEYVPITRMPKHLINAFIATEDWNFFHHSGLSFKGIIRSMLVNLYYGKRMQGASTITQQLVKLHFLDAQKTFMRKIKEQIYALLLERQYSKEQILECYCNSVYFGSGIYGVQAAAKAFWNKDIQDISVDQAALLAAVVCSPGNYSPLFYPLSAQRRRNLVLRKMEKLKFIDSEQLHHAQSIPVTVEKKHKQSDILGHAMREYVCSWIEKKYSKELLYNGGLIIQTTLDSKLQKQAYAIFVKHVKKLRSTYGGDLDGGLISLDVHTGAIRAVVTGYNGLQDDYFNRAFSAKRQQGSVFKPLVYVAALESGMSFADTAIDEPLEVAFQGTVWKPRNHSRSFSGLMTLARALVYSNNIVTIKVLLTLGVQVVADLARRCHITGYLPPYPSLALGCVDSTLVEVAGMFNIFAHRGLYVEPYFITWVKDEWGSKIYTNIPNQERVISQIIADKVGNVLTIGLDQKCSLFKKMLDCQAMSKTGTTNDSRTCWFAGSTPERTTVIYIGCDDNRPMGRVVFPLHTAFPIWLDFHSGITTRMHQFVYDPALQLVAIDSRTGAAAAAMPDENTYQILV